MKNNELPDGLHSDTLGVRAGQMRTGFEETSEPMFLNSGYVYESAEAAEAAFNGDIQRFVYSRYGNPTVRMFEERLAQLEGAEDCFATASGMAAVFNSLLAVVNAGDRVVASRALFGSCAVILRDLLPRWGVTTQFVDGEDLDQWAAALAKPTQAVFFESPSNPMQDIIDIPAVCELARGAGATVILDNVFATPLFQQPLTLGADVVVYSATKHAVEGMTKSMAIEWGPKGIRVNAVIPGPIARTEGMARLAPDERTRATVVAGVPLGRLGTVDDIGAAVVWLCSEAASYVTGAVVPVDGGANLLGAGALYQHFRTL